MNGISIEGGGPNARPGNLGRDPATTLQQPAGPQSHIGKQWAAPPPLATLAIIWV